MGGIEDFRQGIDLVRLVWVWRARWPGGGGCRTRGRLHFEREVEGEEDVDTRSLPQQQN